jgi:hypothetical protein
MRLGAVAVAPQVRHDHPVAVPGDLLRDPRVNLARLGASHIAMNQYQWPAPRQLPVSACGEAVGGVVSRLGDT